MLACLAVGLRGRDASSSNLIPPIPPAQPPGFFGLRFPADQSHLAFNSILHLSTLPVTVTVVEMKLTINTIVTLSTRTTPLAINSSVPHRGFQTRQPMPLQVALPPRHVVALPRIYLTKLESPDGGNIAYASLQPLVMTPGTGSRGASE